MNRYMDGDYLKKNPTWDVEDSPWKADNVVKMMRRNNIEPSSLAEVGCGAGEILNRLYEIMPPGCMFTGYEISPQAIELCQNRKNERLQFHLGDVLTEETPHFDVIMALDVMEHVEDYFGFLKRLHAKAEYKIFHIPLEMSLLAMVGINTILNARDKVGHLHYFCKETALATLSDNGYRIIDWFYTSGPVNRPPRTISEKSRAADFIKTYFFTRYSDKWVRTLGGSMMVLAG